VGTKRKISQTQIARDLGVSQALVSLALNGRSEGIHPETYRRIWDRAISQGYLPKGMRVESAPDKSRIQQIGFILRSPFRLYIPQRLLRPRAARAASGAGETRLPLGLSRRGG